MLEGHAACTECDGGGEMGWVGWGTIIVGEGKWKEDIILYICMAPVGTV